jgi:hypothetical protein
MIYMPKGLMGILEYFGGLIRLAFKSSFEKLSQEKAV